MKRSFGFVGFLTSWALFILNLPDIAERSRKWLPVLHFAIEKLTAGVNALIRVLPRAPDCGACFAFAVSWPTLIIAALMIISYILFYKAYAKVAGEPSFTDLALKAKGWTVVLFGAGQFIVLWLVQAWLLHRYSGLVLTKSLTILSFRAKLEAASDKNFFLHASNIYGLIIIVSYLSMILLIEWAWFFFKGNPHAEPPHSE